MLVDSVRWDEDSHEKSEGNPIQMINPPIKAGVYPQC